MEVEAIIDGKYINCSIGKMFNNQGPFCIYESVDWYGLPIVLRRLDKMQSIEVLSDLSKRRTSTKTSGNQGASTSNVVGRAIVGGLISGGVGAIIGGVTGEKRITTSSISTEDIDLNLILSIRFSDEPSLTIKLTDTSVLEFIASFSGSTAASDDELASLKENFLADFDKEKKRLEKVNEEINKIVERKRLEKEEKVREQEKNIDQWMSGKTSSANSIFLIAALVIIAVIIFSV